MPLIGSRAVRVFSDVRPFTILMSSSNLGAYLIGFVHVSACLSICEWVTLTITCRILDSICEITMLIKGLFLSFPLHLELQSYKPLLIFLFKCSHCRTMKACEQNVSRIASAMVMVVDS